jgi:hypothetical protein
MSFKQQYINEMIKNEPDLLLTLLIGASEELFIDISKYLISSKLQYDSNHISIEVIKLSLGGIIITNKSYETDEFIDNNYINNVDYFFYVNNKHISISIGKIKNNKITFNITSSKIKKIKKHINNILIQ